jgi:hypothetical protein
VIDLQESVPDLTPATLPNVSQTTLRPLVQVAGLAVARGRVAFGLVQGVKALCRWTPALKQCFIQIIVLKFCFLTKIFVLLKSIQAMIMICRK